ncbi:hypothetical protein [Marinobacterium sp. BA1]|uniref:hypothetical protein n=1 Tax=Marinobacterium sp. BA1 TaxID=3138931 RepID=UPI0032E5AF8E
MSTAQKTLIEAVQRIALNPEALASRLGELQKRGVIDGIKTTLGGYNELQDDCCTEGDGTPKTPDENEPIDEDAPAEVPEVGDEDGDGETDWFNCETEEPITFTPGGFPRPETCKECTEVPDDTWQAGFYWTGVSPVPSGQYASPAQICAVVPQQYPVGQDQDGDILGSITQCGTFINLGQVSATYRNAESGAQVTYLVGTRQGCGNDPENWPSSFCALTEPPMIDDCSDWESDNTTSYTLANGCIVASTCDPDASPAAQACNECITICNAEGQERRVCAIGNGQWILYDPSGQFKGGRYDATGKRLEILDKGETGGYLPSEQVPEDSGGYDGGTIGGGDGWVWS